MAFFIFKNPLKSHLELKAGTYLDEMVFANKFFQIMIFNVREFLNGELNIHKGSYI